MQILSPAEHWGVLQLPHSCSWSRSLPPSLPLTLTYWSVSPPCVARPAALDVRSFGPAVCHLPLALGQPYDRPEAASLAPSVPERPLVPGAHVFLLAACLLGLLSARCVKKDTEKADFWGLCTSSNVLFHAPLEGESARNSARIWL